MMVAGRPKLPIDTAIATGAAKANPNRYLPTADLSSFSLGPPSPSIFEEGLIDEWRFFVSTIPWLTESDRGLVELACMYRANLWKRARVKVMYSGDDLRPPSERDRQREIDEAVEVFNMDERANASYLRVLEKLGGTPTSKPKVLPAGNGGQQFKRKQPWW